MKPLKSIVVPMFAATAVVASTASAAPPQSGYLCCNMRSDGTWISDSNYQEAGKFVVPAGTPVQVVGFGRYRVEVNLPTLAQGKQWLGNDYSRDIAMDAFAARYVVREDPRAKLATWPKKVQDAVTSARVTKGMTREQVLMALGYPISSETPHLDAKIWRYWLWTFSEYKVFFDDEGLVAGVRTDADTRMRVVMD
jgi:hypothetical protein